MITIKVVTPRGLYQEKEVKSIHATSTEGEFTLLPKHIPVVMALKPCKLTLTDSDDQKREYAISGGFLHLDSDKASLMTDAIEGQEEIDVARAQSAFRRARERIEKHDSETNMRRAELSLERAMNRLKVSGHGSN